MKINRILSYSFVALAGILLATSVNQVNASTTDTDVSVSQQTETDDIQNSVSNNTESVNVNSNNDLSNTNSVSTQPNDTHAIQESAETQSDSTISSEIVTVAYKHGVEVHSYNGYGENAIYNGNNLATGTSWIVNEKQKANDGWWYEVGNDVWLPEKFVVSTNSTDIPAYNWLTGVPLINQNPELPNGCEITAVTMMLNYAGVNVDKMQLAREMPRSSDPNYGYIGQPWDSTGITIFPNALMNLVEHYIGSAKDLTGYDINAIKYQISIGKPVVTWNTLHGFPYHALVITGYDNQYIYYNDCWTNQTAQMDINEFIKNWATQSNRAISY